MHIKTRDVKMMLLAAGMALPTLLFWSVWTYKGQNYNMPAMASFLLFGFACFNGTLPKWALRLTSIVGILALFGSIALFAHFWPMPEWWCVGWIVLFIASILIFSATFWFYTDDVRMLTIGTMAFFIAFGSFIAPLGEREMIEMRHYIKDNPGTTFHYYNLDPSIWSEWGLLQLTLHYPVYGLHRIEQFKDATKPGHAIIVQNTKWLSDVLEKSKHVSHPRITPWTRWLTKGTTPDGESRWKKAWIMRDLHQLEREFFIIQYK